MTSGIHDTNTVRRTVGARLKEARGKMSRAAAIKALNESDKRPTLEKRPQLTEEAYKKWEYGENSIEIEWLPAICDLYKCDIGFLFGEYDCHRKEAANIGEVTGLSEKAIEKLKLIAHTYGVGVHRKGYSIDPVSVLNDIIESEHFSSLILDLSHYLVYSGALPSDAYAADESAADISSDDLSKFLGWANATEREVILRSDASFMYLQHSCDILKRIAEGITVSVASKA